MSHKVFVSYYHAADQHYRNQFENLCKEIYITKSVEMGDIPGNLPAETIYGIIRDKYLSDSTVTIVLIGKHTWQRKHVDWEISTSTRNTKNSLRSGLLGIILPSHPDYQTGKYTPRIIPEKLYNNIECKYAKIYNWTENTNQIEHWIQVAFDARFNTDTDPDHSGARYERNRIGDSW